MTAGSAKVSAKDDEIGFWVVTNGRHRGYSKRCGH
jgi:hypothetical protein